MAQTKAQLLAGKSDQSVTFNDVTASSLNGGPFGGRNRIINGDMRIDQRNAGAATANTINGYTLDRWVVGQTTTGKLIAQQNAGSAPNTQNGFTNYLGVTSQSAYTVAAGDIYRIYQLIEGNNISDLAFGTAGAKTVTISFWVRSSLTGTFGGSIGNNDGTRSYAFTYSISAANTWEYKSITVPGDTSGTYVTGSGTGIALQWGLGVGSTYSGTAGSWGSSGLVSATGATSVVGTNGATFYITGVQLEQGSTATPFERRSYGQELALCQRYFQKNNYITAAWLFSGTQSSLGVSFPQMRAAPTVSNVSGSTQYGPGGQQAFSSSSSDFITVDRLGLIATIGGGQTTNTPGRVFFTCDQSAEL